MHAGSRGRLTHGAAAGTWRRTGRIRRRWTRHRTALRAVPGRPATAAGRLAESRAPGPSPPPRRPPSVSGGPCTRSQLCGGAGYEHAAPGCSGRRRFSGSQMRCLCSQRRLWVKCLWSRCRSGSAVKRSQDLAFGSPLGSQPGRREVLLKRAMRDRQRSGSGSGAKPGTSTARRRKRRALLDILEKASPPDPHRIGTSCGFPSLHAIADNGCFCAWQVIWATTPVQSPEVWASFTR